MTSLVFVVQNDQICIAVDTLVVGHRDKCPMGFQRKFTVLQPSGLVIAGTGLGEMVTTWFRACEESFASLEFDALRGCAQPALQQVAARISNIRLTPASLFHFGWSASAGRYAGFSCRPVSDWSPVEVPLNQIRMQPEVSLDWSAPFELPQSFVDIQLRQQVADQTLPVGERQGIGGEIEFVHMHERRVAMQVVGQFPTLSAEREYVRMHCEA